MVNPLSPRPDTDETEWHNGNGEAPDRNALAALQLAHRAIAKFPELSKRYQKFIGTAAVVSSALIVLASIAVSRRLRPRRVAREHPRSDHARRDREHRPREAGQTEADKRLPLHSLEDTLSYLVLPSEGAGHGLRLS